MTIRQLALAITVALVVSLAVAGGTTARTRAALDPARLVKPTFVVRGHGWGHGVGMSQWGAYGYAKAGATYQEILAHYYPGTTLGPSGLRRVRVLLAAAAPSAAISSAGKLRVKDATGTSYDLVAGSYVVTPDLKLQVDPIGTPRALVGPLVFSADRPLSLGARSYRGTIEVSVQDGKLRVVNSVGLAQYLWSVVPGEVPDDWPAEALKAQAVAARSYALSHLQTGSFDVFADTRSQVYGGIANESDTTTAAVDATAGQVVLFGGKVASTYFFSTSGGRTASITDVWPDTTPVSYLVSVPDPYDAESPYHNWGPVTVPAAKLAKVLKMPGRLVDVTATANASRRVTDVVGIGAAGSGPAIPATTVREALGLRSTWFSVGVLAIERPAETVSFGRSLSLGALARGLGSVTVEQRAAGEAGWSPVATVAPRGDGTLAVDIRPKIATSYRLSSKDVTSAPVRVAVAPLVRIAASSSGDLAGTVRPVLAGTVVQVERLDGASWTPVTGAPIGDDGRWETTSVLRPGSYRARLAASAGFTAATSPVVAVTQQ